MIVRRLRSGFGCWIPALLLSLALVLGSLPAHGEKVEDLPKPTDWVADFAHVLSPGAVQQIDSLCGQLSHSKANAQIQIVTVKTLDGDEASDFANRLEERWKIGKKGQDRGILMLLAIQDHKRWIEVGYGLEGILNDAKVGDIGRSMVPALRAGDYDRAVIGGTVQLANVIAADAGVQIGDQAQQRPVRRAPRHGAGGGFVFVIIIILVFLFLGGRGIFGFLLGMLLGGGGRWGGGGWGGGGGGWGGGGGGWGGGGGGGGYDGGGGGSSGGGGAGGSW
ncbi:MAG TPA: TPM domain-containing protein [Acidobacteriaceae bacterium]|nr:TPM domain-containing protein [Acidobacteriaceae bacterium]